MGAWQKGADRWQSGLVPYSINPDLANRIVIMEAIRTYETQTNLRFVEHYLEPDHIRFSKQTAGNPNSKTGRKGGEQFVNASGNDAGTLVHELGHALGLMHEHQRPDRDDHITFNPENAGASLDNYEKRAAEAMSAYDIESIMHYHAGEQSAPEFVSKTGVPHGDIGGKGVLTPTDRAFLATMYPDPPVVRRSDGEDGAGAVSETSAIAVPHPQNPTGAALLVNAVRNSSGDYQILNWLVRQQGNVTRDMSEPSSATAGQASDIQVTLVGSHFVSAMRDGSGKLLLISHDIELNRVGDSHGQAGEVRAVHIVALSDSLVLTPVISASGQLLNILWGVGSDGAIRRLGTSTSNGPRATTVTGTLVASGSGTHRVAILHNDESGRLVLSIWGVADSSVTKQSDSGNLMGVGRSARVVSTPAGPLVVACRDGNGDLLLIPFFVSPSGALERVTTPGSAKAGAVRELDAIARPYGVLTAVIDDDGKVLLIKWAVDANGSIRRLGDSAGQAGVGSNISVAALPYISRTTVATTVRAANGNLHPITWDDTGGPGEIVETGGFSVRGDLVSEGGGVLGVSGDPGRPGVASRRGQSGGVTVTSTGPPRDDS